MMPGVVSIPHGWGHDLDGVEHGVAARARRRQLEPARRLGTLEPLTGNAVLNGIPVTLAPARQPATV